MGPEGSIALYSAEEARAEHELYETRAKIDALVVRDLFAEALAMRAPARDDALGHA